jgi:hypothetical protein
MIYSHLKHGLSFVFAVAGMLVVNTALAYTITVGGTPIPNEGLTTSVAGATVIDFNSGYPASGYSGGAVVSGSVSGSWAAPPNDTSNYLTVGPGSGQSTPVTITLGSLHKYFGYYGGSPDSYNYVELWRGGTQLATFSGSQLSTLAGDPNPTGDQSLGFYWNIWSQNSGEYFDKIVLGSTINAFETDNHAFAVVPIPTAVWLFASGLLGLVGFSRRKRAFR